MTRYFPLALVVLLAGCGIPDGKLLKDLSADDMVKVCEETDLQTFTCDAGGGVTYDITIGGSSCESSDSDTTAAPTISDSCTATVGDARTCTADTITALTADPCAALPASCSFYADCYAS
jgi:hypothetical protein